MDFTDGPLATTADLHRLHSPAVGVPGPQCYPAGHGEGVWPAPGDSHPLQHPREAAWGRDWDTAALVSAGGMEKREMRSLQSSRVGCDTGEERGAWRNKELL